MNLPANSATLQATTAGTLESKSVRLTLTLQSILIRKKYYPDKSNLSENR